LSKKLIIDLKTLKKKVLTLSIFTGILIFLMLINGILNSYYVRSKSTISFEHYPFLLLIPINLLFIYKYKKIVSDSGQKNLNEKLVFEDFSLIWIQACSIVSCLLMAINIIYTFLKFANV
jgi:hypothetical protein